MAADEFAVGGEAYVAFDYAWRMSVLRILDYWLERLLLTCSHSCCSFVPFSRVLWELQSSSSMRDGETARLERSLGTALQLLLQWPIVHIVHEVPWPRSKLNIQALLWLSLCMPTVWLRCNRLLAASSTIAATAWVFARRPLPIIIRCSCSFILPRTPRSVVLSLCWRGSSGCQSNGQGNGRELERGRHGS